MLNHFLECQDFRYSFYQRYVALLNTAFGVPYLLAVWDDYRQTVEGEIAAQSDRFGFPKNMARWNEDMEKTVEFFRTRNDYFQQEILSFISVDDTIATNFVCAPNPSTGNFRLIVHSSDNNILPLAIYDIMGRLVYTKDLYVFASENVIPIQTTLSAGLYLVKIGDMTSRLVITK